MNQKEAKRWQNITPTVTCYLKAVIYRTHLKSKENENRKPSPWDSETNFASLRKPLISYLNALTWNIRDIVTKEAVTFCAIENVARFE